MTDANVSEEWSSAAVRIPGYHVKLLFEHRRTIVLRAIRVADGQKCVIKLLKAVHIHLSSLHRSFMRISTGTFWWTDIAIP
jgi:hypothetical protein